MKLKTVESKTGCDGTIGPRFLSSNLTPAEVDYLLSNGRERKETTENDYFDGMIETLSNSGIAQLT